MAYLDAAIGFAMVMAVLAGAVTAVTEAANRLFRQRRRKLLQVAVRLAQDVSDRAGLELSATRRLELVTAIVNNPMTHDDAIEPAAAGEADDHAEARLDTVCDRRPPIGMYDRVSTEHVLRHVGERLLDVLPDPDQFELALKDIARRWDLLSSSVSADFKRKSQVAAMFVGIIMALALNLNGYRVLDEFLRQPELSQEYIGQLPEIEAQVLDRLATARDELDRLADDPTAAELADQLGARVSAIDSATSAFFEDGIPLGPSYPPHCLSGLFGPCAGDYTTYPVWRGFVDAALIVLTGVLIGLGAPFWFDVARRLAEVRQFFSGTGSAEQRKSGEDSRGPKDCNELAERVARDFRSAQKAGIGAQNASPPAPST